MSQIKYDEAERTQLQGDVSDLSRSHFLYTLGSDIYKGAGGGFTGLYDYGPLGAALKHNIVEEWRQHFIIEDDMLELESTTITPKKVLEVSGHVAKFSDFLVRDLVTSDPHRADKLVEEFIESKIKTLQEQNPVPKEEILALQRDQSNADGLGAAELDALIERVGVVSPLGNKLTPCEPFNLMFATDIGPSGRESGFLRPETAQGIFVNFKKLLDENTGAMPFAAAQIGLAFRNEIAPKQGLLRVREFQMAEIEHFCRPGDGDRPHPKFSAIKDVRVRLFSKALQHEDPTGATVPSHEMTMAQIVAGGLVGHPTLAYYIARTQLYLEWIGIDRERLRFRQHKDTEMAHYAKDCWDAEMLTSYGWVECAGLAHRDTYDLSAHNAASSTNLAAREIFDEPRVERQVVFNKSKKVGAVYKKLTAGVLKFCEAVAKDPEEAARIQAVLDAEGVYDAEVRDKDGTTHAVQLMKEHINFQISETKIHFDEYIPVVVEPSFGIGRILYALLEHSLKARDGDAKRRVLRFPPIIAPVKCCVFPISSNPALLPTAEAVHAALKSGRVASKLDSSSSNVGRKYARQDERGTPYCIVVDFDSVKDNAVTIRERDGMQQLRVPIADVPELMLQLSQQRISWMQAFNTFPRFLGQEDTVKASGEIQALVDSFQITEQAVGGPGELEGVRKVLQAIYVAAETSRATVEGIASPVALQIAVDSHWVRETSAGLSGFATLPALPGSVSAASLEAGAKPDTPTSAADCRPSFRTMSVVTAASAALAAGAAFLFARR